MNFKFTCAICKKEVKRGEKFRLEADCYDGEASLFGVIYEDGICKQCVNKIESKIERMTK